MKKKKRPRLRKPQSSKKMGMPPGQLIYIGDQHPDSVLITVMDYDKDHLEERKFTTPEECFRYRDTTTNTWINVDGIYQTDIVEKIGKYFGVSALALEDVVNTNSRPKIDDDKK